MAQIKWKHRPVEIKPYDLLNVAAQSLTHHGDLNEFWEYANKCRECGILKMTDEEIRRMLDDCGDSLHTHVEEQRQHFSSEGNMGLEYEPGGFSGCMAISEKRGKKELVEISPDAKRRAQELLLTLSNYGWTFLGTAEAFHTRLCLDIKFGQEITLKIPGKSKVCLNWRASDPIFGMIKHDDVVAVAFSAMFDNDFINHICSFDSGYGERLEIFLSDYKSKRKHATSTGYQETRRIGTGTRVEEHQMDRGASNG
jgi:hypothetical protein